jgi:hypothetical protein
MKMIKSSLLAGICLLGTFVASNAISFEHVIHDIGIQKIEAEDLSFEQETLCPYPVQLEARVFNDLKIAGMKKYTYRWLLNDEPLETGRFDVFPTAYGPGYDQRKLIIHVGQDPSTSRVKYKENNPGINKLISITDGENPPSQGWYQLLVLPLGQSNWYDAVKSNKADYNINCKS